MQIVSCTQDTSGDGEPMSKRQIAYLIVNRIVGSEEIDRIRNQWEAAHSGFKDAPVVLILSGVDQLVMSEGELNDDEAKRD